MLRVTAIAAHAGMRLGVLRVMSESQHASTDPLTGLLNRSSLEPSHPCTGFTRTRVHCLCGY
ncbi:MAG: hypothetical protein RL571_2155 [Pseudomonadota bacterium]|jgi:GGDEF domain-containing protein